MEKYWHSVTLDRDLCKGCTNCLKPCPTQAIRVQNGKAKILKERCIDCGECIRVCPYHAKKAVTDGLLKRKEEHKILIVLSDGRPEDGGREGNGRFDPYQGEEALKDTAKEVRKARASGISVLGIFAGLAEDLQAEKKIYGKDFAYIRDIAQFSQTVGTYLRKQIDEA